jgi:hypothetical protein
MIGSQSSSRLVVGRSGERWLNVDDQTKSVGVCLLSLSCPSAQSTGSPLFSMVGDRLTPLSFIFRSCRQWHGVRNGCRDLRSMWILWTRSRNKVR